MSETAIPKEDLEPKDNDTGDTAARFVLHADGGAVLATVLEQYADASADIGLSCTGAEVISLIGIPPSITLGASVGDLSLVLKAVPYGQAQGQWYAVAKDLPA
jgi:hypothetical protein